MKLESITLTNFQAHRKLDLELGRITTIQGRTDIGKSAILRAIRWACLNDFAGDDFVKHGEKEAGVTLKINNGKVHVVSRTKGRHNLYLLDDEVYRSFGRNGVPSAIAQLLNLSEINFQGQHDSPFWFNESAGEVSRRLNAIIDLSMIDDALSNVASELRKANERVAVSEERIKTFTEKLEAAIANKPRIEQWAQLCERKAEHEAKDGPVVILDELLFQIREGGLKAMTLMEEQEDLQSALVYAEEFFRFHRRATELEDLLNDIDGNNVAEPPPFDRVAQCYEDWSAIKTDALAVLIEEAKADEVRIASAEKTLQAREKEHEGKTRGTVCPLCGSKL